MNGKALVDLFHKTRRRCHLVGSPDCGVIAGLDLEGRLFTVLDGTVVNRVNPEALRNITTRDAYLNPGGDGLWPAPEGTRLGYEYATGVWRVPPGLTGAAFRVTSQSANQARIEAEIDLINAVGLGVPTLFSREIQIESSADTLTVNITEAIQYLGAVALSRERCLLAPWSLCQFDCGPGCDVIFPATDMKDVWDLYDPSEDCRDLQDDMVRTRTDSSRRYQIGIGDSVPWIRLRLPDRKLEITRQTGPLPAGQSYIDIADAPPDCEPAERRTRYSVYSDTNGFMEIEAAGGCPEVLDPGDCLSVDISTAYRQLR